MTLSQKTVAALEGALAPATLSVESQGARLEIALRENGPVGASFDHLLWTRPGAAFSPEALLQRAESFVAKATYLVEPLRVVEKDDQGPRVLVRSEGPTVRLGGRSYYQVVFEGDGSARLERWRFDEATRERGRVACQLTREVIERIVDDLQG